MPYSLNGFCNLYSTIKISRYSTAQDIMTKIISKAKKIKKGEKVLN